MLTPGITCWCRASRACQDGMTITFDRNTALSRDDMALLSWDHPAMRGGIDLILGSGSVPPRWHCSRIGRCRSAPSCLS